ncbi:mitochondrial genome maintenance exonuclease 1 [Brachionus plicatilis]|uniref:Mitochondrial genome maintenance exonuclease 1 n=1 Tax=Brachionus plicatilis TaxID=10195 RepID=A0A3M7R8K6_BRAPC|nr:mitochondrial genome maintenance exonuclease 1 [Brachionus plicatilis]
MLKKYSILKNPQIIFIKSNLYSEKKVILATENDAANTRPSKKYIGPKDFYLQSFLLKKKLLNEDDTSECYDSGKYFERENKLMEKYLDPVDFCGYPLNEHLHKKHEFYLNEPKRTHSSYDLKKFEYTVKKERRDTEKMEKQEKKKHNKARKSLKENTEEVNSVIVKEEQISSEVQNQKLEEMSSNEFKLDDKAKKILETIKSKTSNVVHDRNEHNSIKKEMMELRSLLEKQEINERKSKVDKYIRFLNNHPIDEKFLIRNLNKVPFLPKQMVLENKNMYSSTEIQLLDAKLLSESKDIYSDKLMPSVSNIIRLAYPLSENLLNWKLDKAQAMGLEGFNIYSQQIKDEGQRFHSYVENRLLNKPTIIYDEHLKALDLIFENIGSVLLTEAPVQHSNLFYHGRIDCLAYYKDELCLIDWKCSEKSKPDIKDLYDIPVQISAYIGAFLSDPRYEELRKSHRIKKGLLVNFNKQNGDVNIHLINFQLSEFFWYKWLNYLRDFWISIIKNRSEK